MGHLIDMLNNIVEISKNSTELVALLNSSMDAEEKSNYEMVLNEMDVQLVSQRRYLVSIYCEIFGCFFVLERQLIKI